MTWSDEAIEAASMVGNGHDYIRRVLNAAVDVDGHNYEDGAWVIITRHPDYETEIETVVGPPVNEIYIDLGLDFDCKPYDQAEADEFFDNLREQTVGAPQAVQDRIEELIDYYRTEWGY